MHTDIFSMKQIRQGTMSVQDAANLFEQKIAAEKAELLSKDGKCYPWTLTNMQEAITQMSDFDSLTFYAFINSSRQNMKA